MTYPTTELLQQATRPVEVTYPGIAKTKHPHGADCYDFLLSWHDIFHAWRNGSNFKKIIRQFRYIHDHKAGLATAHAYMPTAVAALVDMDLSVGQFIRNQHLKQNSNDEDIHQLEMKASIATLFKTAGFNFEKETDDNYLLLDDIAKHPDDWDFMGWQFNPSSNENMKIKGAIDQRVELLTQRNQLIQHYRIAHPNAHIVDIILTQLLHPVQGTDRILLEKLAKTGYDKLFYWSHNSGIYFKKEWRDLLNLVGTNPCLRQNSPDVIRQALTRCLFMPKIHQSCSSLGDGRQGRANAPKQVTIKTCKDMEHMLASIKHKTIKLEDTNPLLQYQMIHTQYATLFNLIKENKTKAYTRCNSPWFFQTNQSTKHMTDTQFMHLGFLKDLYIKDLMHLMDKTEDKQRLKMQIRRDLESPHHLLNFNRTRFACFVKARTTSHDKLVGYLEGRLGLGPTIAPM